MVYFNISELFLISAITPVFEPDHLGYYFSIDLYSTSARVLTHAHTQKCYVTNIVIWILIVFLVYSGLFLVWN